MSKRVLITGGAGYIGSHAARTLMENGYQVVIFDDFSKGHREVVDILSNLGDLQLVSGDLTDSEALDKAFAGGAVEAVVHLAAPCIVDESMKKPGHYFEKNSYGTMCLLEAMRRHGVQNIILSSTCAVYGQAQYLPIDENHPLNPSSVYGEAKLAAERKIQWYGKIYGINYIIFRFFNACGAASDGLIGDSKRPSSLLIPNAVRGALGIDEFQLTFSPVDTEDGSPVRDFIDVEDLAAAVHRALDYLREGKPSEIINIGSGSAWSVKQIIAAVEKELATEIVKQQSEPRVGEIAAIYGKTDKMKAVLGFQPKKQLEDSIRSTIAWFKNRPNGYDY